MSDRPSTSVEGVNPRTPSLVSVDNRINQNRGAIASEESRLEPELEGRRLFLKFIRVYLGCHGLMESLCRGRHLFRFLCEKFSE